MLDLFGKKLSKVRKKIKSVVKRLRKTLRINKNLKKKSENLIKTIEDTVARTGWSEEKAETHIKLARKKVGISYSDYRKYKFFANSEEQMEEAYAAISAKKENRNRREIKKFEKAIEEIIAITGWDREYAMSQFQAAVERTHCTPKEYVLYRFYELTPEEQDQVFVANFSRKITAKYSDDKEFIDLLYNKEKTNEFFDELMGRPWCVNTKISEDDFTTLFSGSERVIYKPLAGNRGKGIKSFWLNSSNINQVYRRLAKYPEGVVEAYVVQHPEMGKLSPYSVNTIRVVTVSHKTAPVIAGTDIMADIAYTSVRIGGGKSVVDNFHSGGMCACIDLRTGEIVTDAVDAKGKVYHEHPVTETTFKGFRIPYYHETLDVIMKTIKEKNLEGYLGWDMAITENGPVLIELNDVPAVALLSAPWVPEKKGQKHIMAKYL